MALKVPDEGERYILNLVRDKTGGAAQTWFMHLYNTAIAFVASQGVADYSPYECSFPGYSVQPLNDWKAVFTPSDGRTKMMHPCISWTATGNSTGGKGTVQGMFVTDSTNTTLIWVEEDSAAPKTEPNNTGGIYVAAPQFTGISEFN